MNSRRGCLVVGESLVDVVVAGGTESDRAGGSALNAAVALSRLGRPTSLLTSYGDDARGELLAEHLKGSGVTVAGDPHVVERTSVARAVIGADGAATYDFDVGWRLGRFDTELLGDVGVVHVCSLAPLLEPGATEVMALVDGLGRDVAVSYDLNVRPAITGTGPDVVERVERMVSRAHLVKASDEDLQALWPDREEGAAVEHLLALGAAAVVVTHGDRGATWHATPTTTAARSAGQPGGIGPAGPGGRGGDVDARAVEVVDTIGAGDTFGAGLLDALWDRLGPGLADLPPQEWEATLAHAARCAAVTVSRVGADPPWRHELD